MSEKEIFLDIEKHLLNDEKPSIYLKQQLKDGFFDRYPFLMIKELQEVEQNREFHPEGNVFIHTMMVVDEGAKNREKSNNKRAFMWALLLHDIGKKPTTKIRKGKLTSYNHDIVGKEMTIEFLNYFKEDSDFIRQVASLVRWHMQSLFVTKLTKYQNINEMLKDVNHNEIVLVALSDRLGRGELGKDDINNTKNDIEKFKEAIYDKLRIHNELRMI